MSYLSIYSPPPLKKVEMNKLPTMDIYMDEIKEQKFT